MKAPDSINSALYEGIALSIVMPCHVIGWIAGMVWVGIVTGFHVATSFFGGNGHIGNGHRRVRKG